MRSLIAIAACAAVFAACAVPVASIVVPGLRGGADPVDATSHDNVVTFSGCDTVTFQMTTYSISSGQPFGGVTGSGNSLHVQAGRHGSAQPAAAFCDSLSILQVMGLDTAWPHITFFPKDLNFAIFGNATFTFGSKTVSCPNMRLGQGHHGFDNNWWIGNEFCLTVPDSHEFSCGLCGLDFHSGNDDHEFIVSIAS